MHARSLPMPRAAAVVVLLTMWAMATPAWACRALPLHAANGTLLAGKAGRQVIDGTCPDNDDPEVYDGPMPHEHWSAEVQADAFRERLSIDACVEISGAMGGRWLQSGSFRIVTPQGNLFGTITGGVGYSRIDTFTITLHVLGGTRRFAGSSGTRVFVGCIGGPTWSMLNAAVAGHAPSKDLPGCDRGFAATS